MQVSKEQIEKARQASLADFFISNGYECEKKGSEIHIRGFGGLYVNVNENKWYQFSERRGDDNPVNCLTDVLGLNFTSAVVALSGNSYVKSYISPPIKSTEPEKTISLEMPENEHKKDKIFAYLIKERKIDPALVQELVKKKLLYQGTVHYEKDGEQRSVKGTAVFVQKNLNGETTTGAEIHGTNTYRRYKAIAGSGEENVFQIKIGTPTKVYAFESAIDLLSFKMLANPERLQNSMLVSMGGLKPRVLHMLEKTGLKIYSCVDNDERGIKFNSSNGFKSAALKLQEENCKDWNELLKKRVAEKEISSNKEIKTAPRRYPFENGNAERTFNKKTAAQFTELDSLNFAVDTELKLNGKISSKTLSDISKLGYQFKDGKVTPTGEKTAEHIKNKSHHSL